MIFRWGHISLSKGVLAIGAVAIAKWLNLATDMCTRKGVQSAVWKFWKFVVTSMCTLPLGAGFFESYPGGGSFFGISDFILVSV